MANGLVSGIIGVMFLVLALYSFAVFCPPLDLNITKVNYKFTAYVVYYPYETVGHNPKTNWNQFLADVALIKSIGFQGVKLHDVWNFWNDSLIDDALEVFRANNLSVILQLYFYEAQEFPQNDTQINAFIAYVADLAGKIKDKPFKWYALHYPFYYPQKESYVANNITHPKYKTALQWIINNITSVDGNHPIYMVSESLEIYNASLPYDLEGVAGYGIQPYSRALNDIQGNYVSNLYALYKSLGKDVYIDEWGVQTNPLVTHGLASSETAKADMIKNMFNWIKDWDTTICYFGLHDLARENADWGLVTYTNQLKKSGEMVKKLLT